MRDEIIKSSFVKPYIEVRPSSIHRYGVFATKDFSPEEIIEECLVLVFRQQILDGEGDLHNRAFVWSDPSRAIIALGCGSIYNHSDDPNANFFADFESKVLKIIATKPIRVGSEVLIDYKNNAPFVRADQVRDAVAEKSQGDIGLVKIFVLFFFLLVLSIIFPIH